MPQQFLGDGEAGCMPAVLPSIVHHVELEPEIDCSGVWQRQDQAGFLGMEDGPAVALHRSMAH